MSTKTSLAQKRRNSPAPVGGIDQEGRTIAIKYADGEEITVVREWWLRDLLEGDKR